ncbi:MAG: ATP-dependent Clp protease ATP-binding subunit [Phycisphaerales bacterium]|nr:ATP-dependent Clp protease ATP-binding subunit [Phycisphaerales bacterium]
MYEKLSKRVDDVVKIARGIAREMDHEYLGTEHLLLAILQEGTGVGARILAAAGIDQNSVRAELDKRIRKSMEDTWVFGRLPGSPHLKGVVVQAVDIAGKLNSKDVCTEHLILAMLLEKGSLAEQTLRALGLTYDAAKSRLAELAAECET